MNRRELAKKGFLGFCAFLAGKKVPDPLPSCGTESNVTYHTYRVACTDVPPGWDFLNDPGEDGYNG